MKISEMLTPLLLAALVLVVMVSAALQQQSDRQTRELLAELTEQLAERRPVVSAPPAEPAEPSEPDVAGASSAAKPADAPPESTSDETEEPAVRDQPEPASTEPAAVEAGQPRSPQPDDPVWATHGPTARWTIENLLAGNYAEVRQRFDEDLKSKLPLTAIEAVMDPIRRQRGAFESITDHATLPIGLPAGMHAFRVTVATAAAADPLVFTITVNSRQQISGLFVR